MIQGHGDDTYLYQDIRINFSSNIYDHADMTALKEHLCRHINLISHYPEPHPLSLERMIAQKYHIPESTVLVTGGATEAIYLIAQTFAGRPFTHFHTGPFPTFREYEDAGRMFGMTPCDTAGRDEMISHRDVMMWLCNPNNPTGHVISDSDVICFSKEFGLVVADQSYENLTLAPVMSHAEAALSDNIIQIHSLTKSYAIPGLRIGYVVATSHLITQLRRFTHPWSVNALAVEAGKWLMQHETMAVDDIEGYLAETQRLRHLLNQIPGISADATNTNFILARIENRTAAELKDFLISKYHILIRDAANFRGLTPYHFRVSTQTPEENNLLIQAITDWVS